MELEFKPGNFALDRTTLETVIVVDVKDDQILVLNPQTVEEVWVDKSNYNRFKNENGKWIVEGPQLTFTEQQVTQFKNKANKGNISERFK